MSMPQKIRVFLVDDHPIFRESFASLLALEPDMEVVGQADTAAETLSGTATSRPHVVLVDLKIPDRDGVTLIEALRAQIPRTKLLVLSAYQDTIRVGEALRAGADGYMVKTCTPEQVFDAIRSVVGGGSPLSPGIEPSLIKLLRGGRIAVLGALSARELQVFRLLAEGLSTREVAALLTISPKTVETHRIRICEKLHCKGPVALARIAFRHGLLDL